LNVRDSEWKLVVGYVVSALNAVGPFPILSLQGEQGSAKSTFARIIRAIIDPSTAPLRTIPSGTRDLMIAARNSWVLSFDNLSSLPPWLSDAFCRLSTGGGYTARELYTDSDETIFDSQRPLILNGIEEICVRDDLLDRTLTVNLPVISPENRKDEKAIFEEFEKARPRILGAFLDAVSCALRNIEDVKLSSLPRMADFAKLVTAAEEALGWEPGSFMKVYSDNRAIAVETTIEASPVAQAVIDMAEETEDWEGTMTGLLEKLTDKTSDNITNPRSWPKTPRSLSNHLKRLAPVLRAVGVCIEPQQREPGTGRRILAIRKYVKKPVTNVTGVTGEDKPIKNEDRGCDDGVTMFDDPQYSSSQNNPFKNNGCDDRDNCDDEIGPNSDSPDGIGGEYRI